MEAEERLAAIREQVDKNDIKAWFAIPDLLAVAEAAREVEETIPRVVLNRPEKGSVDRLREALEQLGGDDE